MAEFSLPTKGTVLQACAGSVVGLHPILPLVRELASSHEERLVAGSSRVVEIDCLRVKLVDKIDCWVSANAPDAVSAAFLHTETVGMVVDRLARLYVEARVALDEGRAESFRHRAWHRMSELASAYDDLRFEISAGRRRLPTVAHLSVGDSGR